MASSLPPNGLSSANAIRAHAQAKDIVQNDASRGNVPVHSFDPDASPKQKAAVAGKAGNQLTSTLPAKPTEGGRELAVDTGSDGPIPTITIEDVDKEGPKDAPPVPGQLPASKAPVIPDWYRVGWRAFTDIDKPPEDDDQRQLRLMNTWISEQYYGQWYYNAAVIIFAVFATHFMTRFNLGFGWLFILLASCCTYYMTSMARVRHRARDDIQRELVKTTLASEHESAEWINQFLDRFWLIYEPVLSKTIIASVDEILSTNCPPFLESLSLTDFTLGNKAPRVDKVRTFPKTESDEVLMDWALSFTPNDISDLTPRQLATKSNPKVILGIRIGKGPASATFPVLVEDMTFSGLLRIRLKLTTNFPHIRTVDISFLENPLIDYVLKPIGGETFGFDMMNIPGLSSFIRDTLHSILRPMMYDPNVFTLNLEQLLSGAPMDTAIGVIKVTVHGARSIGANKIGGGTPDPYVTFSINNSTKLAETKWKQSTHNPTWNESKFLLVNNLTGNLVLTIMDYNEFRKDTEIGATLFELAKLNEDATHDDLSAPILKDGKQRGELRFDVAYFPVLKSQVNESGVEELPESSVGVVRFTIHQAKDLQMAGVRAGDLNAYVKVFLGNFSTPHHTTSRPKHTANPVWESATEYLCVDRSTSTITVKVIDDREFLKDPTLGYLSVRLQDLLDASKEEDRDWWQLSGCKSGRLRLTAEWKPLNMAGSIYGARQYTPPIGAVRLWLNNATDVKNVEAALGGKSDPYVRVLVNNITQARTEVVNNDLNPRWDQIIYTPVHSLKETLLLEVMDYQNLTKDRSLGTVELKVSELAREVMAGAGDSRFSFESTGKMDKSERIRLDRGNQYKGQLHYLVEFLPAFALEGLKFETGSNELQAAVEAVEDGDDADDHSSSSSKQREARAITTTGPVGTPEDSSKNHQPTNATHATESTKGSKSASSREGSPPTQVGKKNGMEQKNEGIRMPKDELLTHQSGIIIFHAKSGELSKKGRLEVLLDDGYWPIFSTTRAHGRHVAWQHVGEGFLKEIDFGRVWLRLNEADEGDKDVILGEYKEDAKAFLSRTLDSPAKFELVNQNEVVVGVVEIETRYVPVPVVLEQQETVNNQGSLRVTLLTGHDLLGVDRGGKSDPYAVFTLNRERVFKSSIKKKTVNPEWHEDFAVSVSSRVRADFLVEIFDWNQLDQAKSLGTAKITLEEIEPLIAIDRTLTLSSEKHGDKGQITIRMVFQPEIIMRSRKSTSTFSAAGRTMTAIGTAPISAGRGVLQGVTSVFKRVHSEDGPNVFGLGTVPESKVVPGISGTQVSQPVTDGEHVVPVVSSGRAVLQGVASVFKRGQSEDGHIVSGLGTVPESKVVPDISGTQLSQPVTEGEHVVLVSSGTNVQSTSTDPGILRVSVLDAKDLIGGQDVKPYAIVRVGEKEFKTKHAGKTVAPEWNETFDFPVGPSTPKLYVSIFDHKTLGKDKALGDVDIDIWQHVQPASNSAVNVSAEMKNGHGIVTLRLSYSAEPTALGRKSNASAPDHNGTLTPPSKFSLRGRRPDKEE